MKANLTIIRHAEASSPSTTGRDIDRPLTKKGKTSIQALCQKWPPQVPPAQCIISSPALRARQTAEELGKGLDIELRRIKIIDRLYTASPMEMESCLYGLDDQIRSVFIVGHNPSITGWVQLLNPPFPFRIMPPAGVVSIAFEAEDWSQFPLAFKNFTFFDFPSA